MIKILNEFTGVTIALLAGIYTFKYMNLLYRIFFFQSLSYLLILLLSYAVQSIPRMQHRNEWLFNSYMPIETGLLTWCGYEFFRHRKEKIVIWIGYAIFLILLLCELFIKGIWEFSNHGYIAESFLIVMVYLGIIYFLLTNQNKTWKHSPELWIALGLILYFGCTLPYLSLLKYLEVSYPKANIYLFRLITVGLANLRYLLLAYGFWLMRGNALKKTTTPHE
ncbi:MAG TPA: hypothetical protein VK783_05710 [Bacteroidia bacterium]|jgi:hypothetical protein|nr:hypothetical protein [Bacteroidia bacterium]